MQFAEKILFPSSNELAELIRLDMPSKANGSKEPIAFYKYLNAKTKPNPLSINASTYLKFLEWNTLVENPK